MTNRIKMGSVLLCICFLLTALWAPLSMTVSAEPETETTAVQPTEAPEPQQLSMYLSLSMSSDRYVTADLTDEHGMAVPYYPIALKVDGTDYGSQYTGPEGAVTFSQRMPEGARTIYCIAPSIVIDEISYIGCSAELQGSVPTQAPTAAPTAAPTQAPTAAPTTVTKTDASGTSGTSGTAGTTAATGVNGVLAGPNTTSVQNNLVAVNVNLDMTMLNAFGLQKPVFDTTARMLMDKTVFAQMVGTASGMVSLNMMTSASAVTQQQLSEAKSGKSTYSKYKDENIKTIVMDLSMQYTDGASGTKITAPVADYTIQLPLPESMKTAEVVAVSRVTAAGLTALEQVSIKNGMVEFGTTQFGTVALVGFVSDSGQALNNLTQNPLLLGILITIGVVLIVGGGLLIWLVVIRKKSGKDKDKDKNKKKRTRYEDEDIDEVGESEDEPESDSDMDDDSDMKLVPDGIGLSVSDLPASEPVPAPEPERQPARPSEQPPTITGDEDVDAILREIDAKRRGGDNS